MTENDNCGLLFVKPHAVTPAVVEYVRQRIRNDGLSITREGELGDLGTAVDRHYHAIASKAQLPPEQLSVPAAPFEKCFGVTWESVLEAGQVVTAAEAMAKLGVDAHGMEDVWRKTKKNDALIKLGGGFYCGKVSEDPPLYCFNGFYMSMRDKYAAPESRIHYFVVSWQPSKLRWKSFRANFVGPTDPREAPENSLRGHIFKNWQALGLMEEPNVGDNAIHGSASPFEAWVEIQNWCKEGPGETVFGKALLEVAPLPILEKWSLDPKVTYGHRSFPVTNSLFDAFEDMDSGDLLALAGAIAASTPVEAPKPAIIHAFQQRVAKLKETVRTGWVRRNVDSPESVADHSLGVAILALVCGPMGQGLNVDKMIKMAILHDLAEHETGDLVVDGSAECRDNITRKEKSMMEAKVMGKVMDDLGRPDLLALWEELEAGQTQEAIYVKDLDRLEMLYQADHYETTQKKELSDFYASTEGKFKHPVSQDQDKFLRNRKRMRTG